MELTLPEGVSERRFNRALADFAAVVGDRWVLSTDEDRDAYLDVFAWNAAAHAPSAAVAPATAEEVQGIVRVANEREIPLWVISRGKNFGYGGASPVLKGSVVLDLSRMKKIEIDEENGVALLEPGVGFYDLYDYVESRGIKLWLSVPGNSWGSVVGNALDRGVGYTSYGDHPSKICGMEVVLPDGEMVRTGTGAMSNSTTWQLQRGGFGPGWDHMFLQSNFGIVTKMGLWMMPEPEAVLGLNIELDKKEDLGFAVDIVAKHRREGTLIAAPSFGNWLRVAATLTQRTQWTDKPGALEDPVIDAIRAQYRLGWWSLSLRFFGYEDAQAPIRARLEREFGAHELMSMARVDWRQGQPRTDSFAGVPITFPLQNVNWHGGRGGHIGYSPTLPARGDLALAQFRRTYDRYVEFGMDYHGSFAMGERYITNVNQLLFNKDDPDMVGRVEAMFNALVADASALGYGEYRAHIAFMDTVANTYDWNNHALRRLNERVKDALDPKGILSPGKSGIWPEKYRRGGDGR
jgi:4-cresol dehydrogenase (hydroxylating)